MSSTVTLGSVPRAGEAAGHVGEFRILGTLGSGGTGIVYMAYQESMRRKVALKVLAPALAASTSDMSRFEREAWIGGRLSHPNIVKVYGRGEAGGTCYIAMELVEGQSLHALIRERKAGPDGEPASDSSWRPGHVRRMVELFVGVADALAQVHEQGIIHRDIKPLNLLLRKDGSSLLLTDFGLARDEEATRVTRRGDFLGTIRYMSPEQLLAQRVVVDRRSDIWSFGVSLYEAVTLDLPYEGNTAEGYISAVATKEPRPARGRNRAVPRDLETVLVKCLQRDPVARYASAMELREDLLRILQGMPVKAKRASVFGRAARFLRRRKKPVTLSLAAAGLGAIGFVALLEQSRDAAGIKRIERALEQVVETGRAPQSFEPEWNALRTRLELELERRPGGSMDRLARRAAALVTVSMPSFGLVSELPSLRMISPWNPLGLDRDRSFIGKAPYIGDMEISWDGGSWRRIKTYTDPMLGGRGFDIRLGDLVDSSLLTPAPHRLDVRVTHSYLDESKLTNDDKKRLRLNETGGGPDPFWLPEAERPAVLFQEKRDLGSFTINLFESYPASFPHAVAWEDTKGSLSSWIRIAKIRVLRVDLPPEGWERTACFDSFFSSQFGEQCIESPPEPSDRRGWSGAAQLWGLFDPNIPLPIAAVAEVRVHSAQAPLVNFPILLGQGIGLGPWGGYGLKDADGRIEWRSLTFDSAALAQITKPVEDGKYDGHIVLSPSRALALATLEFDRYLGADLSLPIQIELKTVRGRWVREDLVPRPLSERVVGGARMDVTQEPK